ncbi:response regulator transcription factor [Clostridium rectalis]|uniref:response regulator transcription factor n=1 Tax=Clostridium rectalis TaxID=2040295 RepID=UPI000F63C936|nr:response regulator transcription factor [Clostridium rectalis]
MNILVADDDVRILRMLKDFLIFNGYKVTTVENGQMALKCFENQEFHLVILDVMMPIYDGWIVCKEIRKTSDIPIIMLTAKDSDLDELFGFDIGVDDYISKPFNIELLLARINRLLKRRGVSLKNVISFKDMFIDLEKHRVTISGENIELSPKEFELIVYFAENIDRVISRDTLLKVIWGDEYFGDTRTVDTHINRLRNKLKEYSKYIKTVRSFGYKLGE